MKEVELFYPLRSLEKALHILPVLPALLLAAFLLSGCQGAGASDSVVPLVQMEYLDRGTVAVETRDGVYLSWRLLGTEPFETVFTVLRNGQRIAEVTDSTNYLDREGTMEDRYAVLPAACAETGQDGGPEGQGAGPEEQTFAAEAEGKSVCVYPEAVIRIPLQVPEGGISAENELYTYSPNDAACADLDGDGEYEIILKWEPSNAFDSGKAARHTGNVFIDAYKLDGSRLWRIDLGVNISAGAHFTQMITYDFDLDAKAELIVKTAPGSRDSEGHYVSEASATAAIRETDNLADYRGEAGKADPTGGRVLSGDEFLTVFDGRSGRAVDTVYYPFPRGSVEEWGDDWGNRSERYLAAAAYLDGVHPYFIAWRGYYARTAAAAYRLTGGRLVPEYSFDSSSPGVEYTEGQGSHNLAVADVDNDGKDEILCGCLALDHDLSLLWCSGWGHGDALHLADYDPEHEGMEYFCVHEFSPYGMTVFDAATGEELVHIDADEDTGRGMMARTGLTDGYYEIWAARGYHTTSARDFTGCYASYGGREFRRSERLPLSHNFRIFWDADLCDELLDGCDREGSPVRIIKQDTVLAELPDTATTNGTKQNVSLMADILGDWREEIVVPSRDGQELLIYISAIPTTERVYTLMHDRAYRMQAACQNAGYNQPPHLGYYLGEKDDERDGRRDACRIRTVHQGREYSRKR